MNLVRGVGRLLLGGFYIVNGVKTLKDPARYAAQVEPVLDRVVPLARKAVGTGAADARRRLTMETEQAKKRARKETKRLKASAKRGAKQIRAGLEGSRA